LALFDWLKKRRAEGESPATTTLCVGNLAMNVTRRQLHRLFGRYGTVVNARVATHPDRITWRLGFGFVEMADGADAAIMGLDGATFKGRILSVAEAEPILERGLISPDEFRELLLEHQRPTREMVLTSGDPGCLPITKISGIPWWPSDLPRPCCRHGHPMSFMAQFRLSDVPTFESYRDSLVSFHYCEQCCCDGNMSFGWKSDTPNGYDVSVINAVGDKQADGLGTIGEVVIDPQSVTFRDAMDAPGYEDTMFSLNLPSIPDDYPQGADDFDENIYPGLIHIMKRKVGGWPSWVQWPEPPETSGQESLHFVGQLDWRLCDRASWCAGGYAYLFLISSEDQVLRGELSLQTT
jgi:hypothetical protein